MAYLLICVRRGGTILNYGVYSRDLAPIQFDDSAIGLALRHDPCTDAIQYFLLRAVLVSLPCARQGPYSQNPAQSNHVSGHRNVNQINDSCTCANVRHFGHHSRCEHGTKRKAESQSIDFPRLSLVQLEKEYILKVKLPAKVAYYSFQELGSSLVFRDGFIKYLCQRFRWKDKRDHVCACEDVYDACDFRITVPRIIEVSIQTTPMDVCHAWYDRLEGVARKKVILEETMAWLSTLGGGFSSLGDYFAHFSEKAGKLSMTQLRIAMEMGDPIMAAKCRLFFALSLMQRNELRRSKCLIRNVFQFGKMFKVHDQKLLDMCKGMWSKLQYFYYRERKMKLSTTSSKEVVVAVPRQKLFTANPCAQACADGEKSIPTVNGFAAGDNTSC